MAEIARTQEEIDRVLNWAHEGREKGGRLPGMSYEDGVLATIDWLTGYDDVPPDAD